MENNNYYKYVSNDEFGTVYIVLPNSEKGFNCGYSLFIPTGCNIDTTLLVHCCNTGGYGVTNGTLDSSKRAIHLDEANEAAKISSLGGHLNYGYELKIPVLTPLIPRVQGYDTHFFGSRVYNNDISYLVEDNNKRNKKDKLSDEEIIQIKEQCRDLPNQVACMIMDANKLLLQMGISVDEKVIIEGYSAGSKFASGFTLIHPELVKVCICGGNSGISNLPLAKFNNQKLNYPLGVADVKNFNFGLYSSIPKYYYIGSSDYNDPAKTIGEIIDGMMSPLYEGCYTKEEVTFINTKLGTDVQNRFDNLSMIYSNLGINATFHKFDGNHKTAEGKDNNSEVFRSVCNFINTILNNEKTHESSDLNKVN